MSLESQRTELQRAFGDREDISIVSIYEESKSAKTPGRPIFADMISRIEKGEAEGVIAWAPDRLARNSIDGGRVVYLLDRGVIRDLKFSTYTFENNSQGKFMLSIMFGQSKYYSDALSDNVKRGYRTKLSKGWRPNLAPLGYLNDPATKTIVPDPDHLPVVRQIFELMLTSRYSIRQIALIARDEWGYRTPRRRNKGGAAMPMNSLYQLLRNPFYAGIIVWGGTTYPGKHEPIVSVAEFERVQSLLQQPSATKNQKHGFPFMGLIRCASCEARITAQYTTNRFGTRYVYYHCVKQRLGPRCREPSVEGRALERQIVSFLQSITVPMQLRVWVLQRLAAIQDDLEAEATAQRLRAAERAESIAAQLRELTALRLRKLVDDNEFVAERKRLQEEERDLIALSAKSTTPAERIKPFDDLLAFSNQAMDSFLRGNNQEKTAILKIAVSNPTLGGGKLSTYAAKPLQAVVDFASYSSLLADEDDVQTPPTVEADEWVVNLAHSFGDESEYQDLRARLAWFAEHMRVRDSESR